ncbi:MAG: energy transducer TonB [Muribaculum sp.]|uniref:Energy transducer TonB n=1 Tax=Candidatus Merdivivens faecigallinarum TaxID=2840871 RepID=A0A9D9NPM5_9BACT|nr:energy transducer TonB [Candidatus Merdivivens faecigallinarum]
MELKKSPKANLENKKTLFTEIGLIVALAVVLVAFEHKTREKAVSTLEEEVYIPVEEEIIPITQETPPPKPDMPKIPQLSDEIDIVSDDIQVEDIIINTEDIADMGVQVMDYVAEVEEEEIEEEIIMSAAVEEEPSFNGGDKNDFSRWVQQRLVYPQIALENGIQGTVMLQFDIDKDGNLVNIVVLRGIDKTIDEEAVRVVSSSPKWSPGRNNDLPVKVRYIFPVQFQLR